MRGGEGETAVGGRDGLSNDAGRRGEVRTGAVLLERAGILTLMRVARRPIRGPGCVGVLFSSGLHEVRSGSDGPCRPERQGVIGDA